MKWAITTLGAVIAAVALSACGAASARPASQEVTPAPAAAKATAQPASVRCFPAGGRAYLTSPGAGVAAVSGCTISVKPIYPLSAGQAVITVTAPDGSTGSYTASWRG